LRAVVVLVIATAVVGLSAAGQQPIDGFDSDSPAAAPAAAASLTDRPQHPNERLFLKHLALDQKAIWTSPAHIKSDD